MFLSFFLKNYSLINGLNIEFLKKLYEKGMGGLFGSCFQEQFFVTLEICLVKGVPIFCILSVSKTPIFKEHIFCVSVFQIFIFFKNNF